jgi:predicted amidohydrolase
MSVSKLTVAVITEVFFNDSDGSRLAHRLFEARQLGAELAVLPELPLDPWIARRKDALPDDAEAPGGRRHRIMAAAARHVGISLLGGAIIRDPQSGRRHNTALLFDVKGALVAAYSKIHIPYEEGFWESAHYEAGADPPRVVTELGLPIGIQICSDANRTSGCHLLAAQGAAAIFVPRATPESSWERWRLVLRADAVTSGLWIVTANRPAEGRPSPIGGPSAVIAPDGAVVAESTDPILIATIDGAAVFRARRDYPGYLDFQPEVHGRGWLALAGRFPSES